MKCIYLTPVFIKIVFLLSQSCNAESTKASDKPIPQLTSATQKSSGPPKSKRIEETSHSPLLSSSQWHVRKLKSPDFTTKVVDKDTPECKPEKIADVVERRKQEYYADASVMRFVSALPLNASYDNATRCGPQTRRHKAKHRYRFHKQAKEAKAGPPPLKAENKLVEEGPEPVSKPPCRDGEVRDDCDIDRVPEYGPHDYAFSSIEYYDENASFGISHCPETVEQISLEIAELRQYDFECEMLTKWIGLD